MAINANTLLTSLEEIAIRLDLIGVASDTLPAYQIAVSSIAVANGATYDETHKRIVAEAIERKRRSDMFAAAARRA